MRRRPPEAGYALLALLAAAAALLATLALAIPRMAMQSQRLKDERLIERGEEYRRAIRLYYRAHGKYPEDIDDLEETDGVRYLRRRYEDPMHSSGDWRLIHMGRDGRFEDSLLYDLAEPEGERDRGGFGGGGLPAQTAPPQLMTGLVGPNEGTAATQPPGMPPPESANRALAVRQSAAPDLTRPERYDLGFGFGYDEFGEAAGMGPEWADDGELVPDYSQMLPSMIPMDENYLDPSGAFGLDPSGRPVRPRSRAGRSLPGNGGAVPGQRSGPANPGQLGAAGPAPGGSAAPAVGSRAPEAINRLLTTPRSDAAQGATSLATGGRVFERGIAGVASRSEKTGVKRYNDKESYHEWEFVYDYRQDPDARSASSSGSPSQSAPVPVRRPGTQRTRTAR